MTTRSPAAPVVRDLADALPQPWSAAHEEALRCVQIRRETHDVLTFVLAAHSPRSFRYLPGQFITLELDIDGQRVNRCYTLSSTPTRPDLISITVKRVPGGLVSNWLHQNLRVGMDVAALGPSGVFSCFAAPILAPAPQYLFISGGSGVTPLMSMARALHDLGSDADIVFLHCARSPEDLLFPEELALMARNMARLRLGFVCEQQPAGSHYAGALGRLDAARLAQIAPDFLQRAIYTCGPAPFMAAVRSALDGAGFERRHYHEESFDFAASVAQPSPAPGVGSLATTGYQIQLKKTKQVFNCRADQTILNASVEAGLRLPFSCANGICGSCKTQKISGQVVMQHAGGIRQREIDQGWILLCCSKPVADIELER